jgi:hypothetical protein
VCCKLCQNPDPLRQSHIIPEFFYKPIYDLKHRFPVRKGGRIVKGRALQKGIREKLLCGTCERKLSVYEKYIREVLFGGSAIAIRQENEKLVITGLDYQRVRIFFLSLIWRMSVATSHRMWQNVDLGRHEEKIRRMILAEDPGEPWEYGFLCILPMFDGKFIEEWILEPDIVQTDRSRIYRMVVGGCIYLFHVSDMHLRPEVEERLVQKDGSWILTLKDARKIEFIYQEAKRVYGAAKEQG